MNTEKTTIISCLLILLAANLLAQNFSLNGRATDLETDNAVAEATLSLNNSSTTVTTDALGNFHMQGLKKGNYILKVSCLGFEKYEKNVSIVENTELQISLKSSPINLDEVTVSQGKSITQ